ncbi:ankyrin repeat domain-containing protein [Leptonema illini]|nr:ankyrin repeat domain-containing protein [Leptonema illini]
MKYSLIIVALSATQHHAQALPQSSLCDLDLHDRSAVSRALDLGANPNQVCSDGLKAVARPMSLDVFSLLIRKGAEVPPSMASEWLSNIVRSAATLKTQKDAAQVDSFEMAQYLLKKGGRFRRDELIYDRLFLDGRWIRLCLDNGADPNADNGNGWTPLFAAANADNIQAGELLLKAGANPNIHRQVRGGNKQSLLAFVSESPRWTALLKRYGAKE